MPDYEVQLRSLQRLDLPDSSTQSLVFDAGAVDAPVDFAMRRVVAIGQSEGADTRRPAATGAQHLALAGEKLLMALSGRSVAYTLRVHCDGADVDFSTGTWSTAAQESVDVNWRIVDTASRVAYPTFETAKPRNVPFQDDWLSGYALGTPSVASDGSGDGTAPLVPLDRLVAAVGPGAWGFQVLAMPVAASAVSALRSSLLAELVEVSTFVHSQRTPDPGAEHYMELAKRTLETFSKGIAVGMWRVGVYLFGSPLDYYCLASAWKGAFSGEDSIPDSVRVIDDSRALQLAQRWALPRANDTSQHGRFRHPLAFQTLMSSTQLAAYCSLPRREVAGLTVRRVFRLDLEPPVVQKEACQIGTVVADPHDQRKNASTTKSYRLDQNALREHAFVAGVTGSGKTNTVFGLLRCIADWGIPFLVIEPAKGEYRRLLSLPWCEHLKPQLYTLGNENDQPLRMNPFEVLGGRLKDVGKHIDLLRSVFTASFGLWSPLPEVLERCIHSVYEDCGWDPLSNTNYRVADQDAVPPSAYPTLSDLVAKVEHVLGNLGYDKETTSRMRAALVTRLDGLRAGAKGTMLDCHATTDMNDFLSRATVLELQDIGSDDDKAFVMGLLMIRLAQHLETLGDSSQLRLVLVIEEAHRLLGQSPAKSSEQGDPRAKAVETFSNMLAEVRSRGLSIIVADQSPSSMAPSVIRNTNLKIAHRLLAKEERHVMAGAVNLTDDESAVFSTIPNTFATFFGKGDDRPVLVRVDKVKPDADDRPVVRTGAASFRARNAVRRLCEDPEVARRFGVLATALAELQWPVTDTYQEYLGSLAARCPPDLDISVIRGPTDRLLAARLVRSRGEALGLSYEATDALQTCLDRVLAALAFSGRESTGSPLLLERRKEYSSAHAALFVRSADPFPRCSKVCGPLEDGGSAPCLYRLPVAALIEADSRRFVEQFEEALAASVDVPVADEDSTFDRKGLLAHCRRQTRPVLGHLSNQAPPSSSRRIALCFAQQAMRDRPGFESATVVDGLIDAGGLHE